MMIMQLWKRFISCFRSGGGSVPIRNSWAGEMAPEQVAQARKIARILAAKALKDLKANAPVTMARVPRRWRHGFEELVFAGICRAVTLDGEKEFSWELVAEHLQAVLDDFAAQALGEEVKP